MPKLISESMRQHIIKISEQLNQTVYIRKDRAVGTGGVAAYFHVAVHPNGAVIWGDLGSDTCKKLVNEFQVKQ